MKKVFSLLIIFAGLLLTGCQPMDDIHDETNEQLNSEPTVGTTEYTLVEEDYTDILDLEHTSFNDMDEAKELVPVVLNDMYSFWGKGSQALVTFDLYSPQVSIQGNLIEYTLINDDYDSEYGNFDNVDAILSFLSGKYPNAERGQLVKITYEFFSGGSTNTLTNPFIFDGDNWLEVLELTDDQYIEMGESYPNFSGRDVAETKIGVFLNMNFPYEQFEEGDKKIVLYKYYDGDDQIGLAHYAYMNGEWTVLTSIATETLQFGHDGDTWVPDNTIKHELTPDDFAYIGDALADDYPGPASSAGNYGNFDRREGNSNYWSREMILEGMNLLLNQIDADAEIGQKYEMTYDIYNGTSTTEKMNLIKIEGGDWIINEDI